MNILVTFPMDKAHQEKLMSVAPEHHYQFFNGFKMKDEEVFDFIPPELFLDTDILIGHIPDPLMPYLFKTQKMKWVQLDSSGVNRYMNGKFPEGKILLTNGSGCYGLEISEYLICATIMMFMKMDIYARHQQKHLWHDEESARTIAGSTALIVGAGNIGTEFARRFKMMGGHTIGVKRTPGKPNDVFDEMYPMTELDSHIPRADVISLSVPETKDTYHLFDRKRIALIRPDAYLINVGRGSAVDLMALSEALQKRTLAGATLDVTEPEPLPADHPLWDAPGAIITPHVSGGYFHEQTYEFIFNIFATNLRHFMDGELDQMVNIVDFQTGYTKNETKAVAQA